MSTPTTKVTRELIRMACRAPSIHNSQPWSWRLVSADTVELHADRSRQLTETDPQGRSLVISCGAALHHFGVAADGFGLATEMTLLPDGSDSDFLARIHLSPGEVTASSVAAMAALEDRATDRRGFTDWEVPMPRLRRLAEAATGWGAHTEPIADPGHTARVRDLIEQARAEQHENPRIAGEQAEWINHGPDDGVPATSALPHVSQGATRTPDRFNPSTSAPGQPASSRQSSTTPADVHVLIFTAHDDPASWLAAGQALSALWIRATQEGISLTPDTQVIEVSRTRELLRRQLLDDLGHPQVLVHVGWPETSRSPQESSPRRALDEVLLP